MGGVVDHVPYSTAITVLPGCPSPCLIQERAKMARLRRGDIDAVTRPSTGSAPPLESRGGLRYALRARGVKEGTFSTERNGQCGG